MFRSYSAVLRGGSRKESVIFEKAIYVGKEHGINFAPGTQNKADGNCLYEGVIDNWNWNCFTPKLDATKPEKYRKEWNEKGEVASKKSAYYTDTYTDKEWKDAWFILQSTNQYDLPYFGDMAILSCAHSLKKDILVINTPVSYTHLTLPTKRIV